MWWIYCRMCLYYYFYWYLYDTDNLCSAIHNTHIHINPCLPRNLKSKQCASEVFHHIDFFLGTDNIVRCANCLCHRPKTKSMWRKEADCVVTSLRCDWLPDQTIWQNLFHQLFTNCWQCLFQSLIQGEYSHLYWAHDDPYLKIKGPTYLASLILHCVCGAHGFQGIHHQVHQKTWSHCSMWWNTQPLSGTFLDIFCSLPSLSVS